MKKIFSGLLPAILLSAVITGCAGIDEELYPADITLPELEKRMSAAMDPNGRYKKAKTVYSRQTVSTARFLDEPLVEMVEVKYEHPGNFRWVTFEDNEPSLAIITNGEKSWIVNYDSKKIIAVDSEKSDALDRIRTISRIADPGSKLSDVFSSVDIQLCRTEDGEFYKLTCRQKGAAEPFYIYVGKNDHLTRRFKGVFNINGTKLDYEAKMLKYSRYEGVRIPSETEIISNGQKQTSKVIDYLLDSKMSPADFRPPVF